MLQRHRRVHETHPSRVSSVLRSCMSRCTTCITCSASTSVRPERSSLRPILHLYRANKIPAVSQLCAEDSNGSRKEQFNKTKTKNSCATGFITCLNVQMSDIVLFYEVIFSYSDTDWLMLHSGSWEVNLKTKQFCNSNIVS